MRNAQYLLKNYKIIICSSLQWLILSFFYAFFVQWSIKLHCTKTNNLRAEKVNGDYLFAQKGAAVSHDYLRKIGLINFGADSITLRSI